MVAGSTVVLCVSLQRSVEEHYLEFLCDVEVLWATIVVLRNFSALTVVTPQRKEVTIRMRLSGTYNMHGNYEKCIHNFRHQ
jgi:hypothetical protein